MKPHARLSLPSLIFFLFSLCVFALPAFAKYPASFASTFALAEKSACKEVVLQLKDGATTAVLENRLHALTQAIFPYQMEVTNGYHHGFFLEALRGYAAMQNDNPPVAFRHFNNALLYYDEDAVFGHTEPLAEIYSAIGETCVAVGRYMDAKDWLDTAFLEAGDNTRIQANVLRASIRLGHAIGDFPDIILSYQYLQSIDTLRRDEIADYAQILFWTRKDREGFGQLLRGIATHGIDNDLGVRDSLVSSFLNNIMRADDSEVRWFYDLLGWSITDARAKAGDEEYLAFLLSARTMLNRVYDFLEEEDDLEKVRERIDVVKEQLAAGYDVFGQSIPKPPRVERARATRPTPESAEALKDDGSIAITPSIAIEDALMRADWYFVNEDNENAKALYTMARAAATGTFAEIRYDGTTAANAAAIGLLRLDPASLETYTYQQDTSYRAAQLTLYLYRTEIDTIQKTDFDIHDALRILPAAHEDALETLRFIAVAFSFEGKYDEALETYTAMYDKKASYSTKDVSTMVMLYSARLMPEKMFSTLLNGMQRPFAFRDRNALVLIAACYWPYAHDADIEIYQHLQARIRISLTLTQESEDGLFGYVITPASEFMLPDAWRKKWYEPAKELMVFFENEDNDRVLSLMEEHNHLLLLPKYRYIQGITHLRLSQTNEAFTAIWRAYQQRMTVRHPLEQYIYPTFESASLEQCLSNSTNRNLYVEWLKERHKACRERGHHDTAQLIEQTLENILKDTE